MTVKWIHRTLALILGAFIISHLGVHLTAVAGPQAHLSALDSIQWIYRNPVGETLLVLAILMQIYTGARRLRFSETAGWAQAQVISGVYLIIFFVLHTGAALFTHNIHGLETDFYWSAGSLKYEPIRYFFAVYYLGAVVAIFTHLAAALHFSALRMPGGVTKSLPLAGAATGAVIVIAFSGLLYPIEVNDDVAAYFQTYFGAVGVKP